MGTPDHLTCLLRNLYAGQEATELDMEQWIGSNWEQNKSRLYIVLFNLYAEYIMRNARLDETQARIKIARRNISNIRYANDTIPVVESKEELEILLMKVKEESGKAGLKFNIQKTIVMASGPISSVQLLSHV